MTPINTLLPGILDSGITGNLLVNNYLSITTATVTSGGQTTITFNSIPQTYTNLEIRMIGQNQFSSGSATGWSSMRVGNGSIDSTSGHYAWHNVYGDGTTVGAGGNGSDSSMGFARFQFNATPNSTFGSTVMTILDYTNTTKAKTMKYIGGYSAISSGQSLSGDGVWTQTSAIDTITFFNGYGFQPYTQFALYGVK